MVLDFEQTFIEFWLNIVDGLSKLASKCWVFEFSEGLSVLNFRTRNKSVSDFCESFPFGFPKLPLTCPDFIFEKQSLFGKIPLVSKANQSLTRNFFVFWPKVLVSFPKRHDKLPIEKIGRRNPRVKIQFDNFFQTLIGRISVVCTNYSRAWSKM